MLLIHLDFNQQVLAVGWYCRCLSLLCAALFDKWISLTQKLCLHIQQCDNDNNVRKTILFTIEMEMASGIWGWVGVLTNTHTYNNAKRAKQFIGFCIWLRDRDTSRSILFHLCIFIIWICGKSVIRTYIRQMPLQANSIYNADSFERQDFQKLSTKIPFRIVWSVAKFKSSVQFRYSFSWILFTTTKIPKWSILSKVFNDLEKSLSISVIDDRIVLLFQMRHSIHITHTHIRTYLRL